MEAKLPKSVARPHVQMIDNDFWGNDDLYFKHFRVKDSADKDRI
jgi:hypothetical protein